ncbi:Helix-turn-helix domain-containing protein [Azotobacter beijerinckii]|uniref:Helix-turn-helix domain-containing protein n=1 Tax=Azotobacter beijerinckii TaxID=170623 RepID=A0A1H9I537_9GAMM|nr:helix-turn-helix domain-containing protein [Azotobacter beijerinckii]SEQ69667.1 Helix-turn-helix domain-containing protein [Azotobacter beijerinckii]
MPKPVRHFADASPLSPADLMTPEQVATALDLRTKTLAAWRSNRRSDLPWYRIGNRIRYRRQDVIAWLESRRQTNGSAA